MGTNTGTREHEMAGERLLSEAQCKAARASSRLFYLNDGGGLRLRVRPNGSRHWIYRYRFGDLEKSTSLGPYPEVSLKAARQRLQSMRAVVRDGKDPVVVKRVNKAQGIKGRSEFFRFGCQRVVATQQSELELPITLNVTRGFLGDICYPS